MSGAAGYDRRRAKRKVIKRNVDKKIDKLSGVSSSQLKEKQFVTKTRMEVIEYMRGVMNDKKATPSRRDEMALSLGKVFATMPRDVRVLPQLRLAEEAKPKPAGPKPRVSTYISKKKIAEAAAKTAQAGSAWAGLVNGSGKHADDEDEAADDSD